MKLKEALQARDPATLIPPDLGPWAHDFARILRAGRKPDEVTEVMNWCLKDKFWAPVIVSGGVFVRNFDKMLGRMRQGDSTSSPAPIEEPGSDPDFEPVTTNDGRVKWRKKPPATQSEVNMLTDGEYGRVHTLSHLKTGELLRELEKLRG